MNAKERNLLISKYVFMILVGLNIINSIWVIINDRIWVADAQEKYPDDWYTGKKNEGYYAKYWFIACIVVMIINDLLSLGAFFAVYHESSQIVMIYSTLMFVTAVYCAWDKYIKLSVSGFLFPLATGIVGLLYASLNYIRMFDNSTLPGVTIQYLTKTNNQPSTPTIENYDEIEKLKTPDP